MNKNRRNGQHHMAKCLSQKDLKNWFERPLFQDKKHSSRS